MVQQTSDNLAQSNNSNNSRGYHQTLWDYSPTAQAVYQLNGIILDANQAFANLIGRTIIETLGLNIWAITPAKYHHLQQIEQVSLEKEGKFTAEQAFLDPHEQPIPVRLSGIKLELAGNSLVLLSAEKISSPSTLDSNPAQSVNQLSSILDGMGMGIFWKDRNSVYLGCNQKFAEFVGLASPTEIVGKTDDDLPWNKEGTDWWRECDRRVLDSKIPEYNIIEPLPQADGSQKWLKTNKMLFCDSHGNIIGIAGTCEDITERVELEKQLKEQVQTLESLVANKTQELISNQARFEKLLVNVPGAIYQLKQDIHGSFSFPYISSDCEAICERTSEQIMQNAELILSLIHPEDLSNFEQVVEQSAQTLQHKHWEGRIITPSGQTKWIQTASKPEKQADGSIVWDGFTIDISDRKQAEQKLRESQQLLHLILDTLPQRVFWKDKHFNYLGCNKVFAQDAGFNSPKEVIGKNDFELSWHKSASLYHADEEVILAGGTPKLNYEEFQNRDDGSIVKLRISKLPLKDKNGRIIGLFGSYEDISNIGKQEQQTENAKYFLEKAIDSINSPIFVKDTNHKWVLVNDAYCKFLGYSQAEILGKSEPDFFSQAQADIYWAKDELVMLSGGQEIDEEPFIDAEGNEKIIITKKSCFQDLDGNTFLLGMITDIYDA